MWISRALARSSSRPARLGGPIAIIAGVKQPRDRFETTLAEYGGDGGPIAAGHDACQRAGMREHDLGNGLAGQGEAGISLVVTTAGEALLGPPTGSRAALQVTRSGAVRDDLGTAGHSDAEAALTDDQQTDAFLGHSCDQRRRIGERNPDDSGREPQRRDGAVSGRESESVRLCGHRLDLAVPSDKPVDPPDDSFRRHGDDAGRDSRCSVTGTTRRHARTVTRPWRRRRSAIVGRPISRREGARPRGRQLAAAGRAQAVVAIRSGGRWV